MMVMRLERGVRMGTGSWKDRKEGQGIDRGGIEHFHCIFRRIPMYRLRHARLWAHVFVEALPCV